MPTSSRKQSSTSADPRSKRAQCKEGSEDGIHLNRNLATNLRELRLPASNGESIWLFGAGGEPPQDSFLVGNLLHNPDFYYFNHPRFRPGECVTQWTSDLDDEPSRISKA